VIRDTLARNSVKLRAAIQTLIDDAAQGDVQAAKLLVPYLNQALGLPTETVEVKVPQSAADLERMPTPQLEAHLATLRAARRESAAG